MRLLKTNDMRLVPIDNLTQYMFEDDLWEFLEEHTPGTSKYISFEGWKECFEEVDDWSELNNITENQINGEILRNFMKGAN